MNNLVKFVFPTMAIALAANSFSLVKHHQASQAVFAADMNPENGLVTVDSPYNVAETGDRLESIINEKGLTLFARIDHSANAADAGLELNPTELLILGNPQVGTPLMQCSITTAIDLPQKILVYQDKDTKTKVAYNEPEYLKQRHNIEGCDEVIEKVSGALQGITEAAVK